MNEFAQPPPVGGGREGTEEKQEPPARLKIFRQLARLFNRTHPQKNENNATESVLRGTRRITALIVAVLLALPADSLQGALPVAVVCGADPPPQSAGAAIWFPRDPQFAVSAGREMLARQNPEAALCYFQKVDAGSMQDPAFWLDLGRAYWGASKPDEAVGAWEKARQLGLQSDELLDLLREGYVQTRQWEKAAAEYESALARKGNDPQMEYRLAAIRAALDPGGALELLAGLRKAPSPIAENAGALEAAIRAATVYQDPAYLYAKTGEELIRLGEPALAEEALNRAIARNPDYGEAYALLGLARETTGEDPEAAYRQGVQYAPRSAMACLVYGSWLLRKGETEQARLWLNQAWTLKPGDWIIAGELAKADFVLGDVAAAEEALLEAVNSYPAEPGAWMALAAFYLDNDLRVEESGIPAARQAVLLAPKDPQALDLLGFGWYKAGDFAEADRLLRSALEQDPDYAKAHLHLGLCLLEEGQSDAAIAELQAAVRLDPGGADGAQAANILQRIPTE